MCNCNLCNQSEPKQTNLGKWFVRFPNPVNPEMLSVHGEFVGHDTFTDEQVAILEDEGKTIECAEHELEFQKLLVICSEESGIPFDYEANAYPYSVREEAWMRMCDGFQVVGDVV